MNPSVFDSLLKDRILAFHLWGSQHMCVSVRSIKLCYLATIHAPGSLKLNRPTISIAASRYSLPYRTVPSLDRGFKSRVCQERNIQDGATSSTSTTTSTASSSYRRGQSSLLSRSSSFDATCDNFPTSSRRSNGIPAQYYPRKRG